MLRLKSSPGDLDSRCVFGLYISHQVPLQYQVNNGVNTKVTFGPQAFIKSTQALTSLAQCFAALLLSRILHSTRSRQEEEMQEADSWSAVTFIDKQGDKGREIKEGKILQGRTKSSWWRARGSSKKG